LASKKITIFLVPDYTNRVKQFRVPRFLAVFSTIFCALCAVFLFWVIPDYLIMKARMPKLAQLEVQNAQQKKQFVHLAQRVDQITQKMGRLSEFDRRLKVMVNMETDGDSSRPQGVGGAEPLLLDPRHGMLNSHKELVRSMHRSLDKLDKEITFGEQDKVKLHELFENQKMLLASTPSIWPTKGWLSSRFGYRISPFTGEREFHKGIDISSRMSAPIVAPANGVVSSIDWDRGYGKVMLIKHGYGLMTRYAHLEKALVKKGQYVKRGETIALVGNTGRSTGPHLHYEVLLNRVAVNPLRYILN
jgi:hypothetical protein